MATRRAKEGQADLFGLPPAPAAQKVKANGATVTINWATLDGVTQPHPYQALIPRRDGSSTLTCSGCWRDDADAHEHPDADRPVVVELTAPGLVRVWTGLALPYLRQLFVCRFCGVTDYYAGYSTADVPAIVAHKHAGCRRTTK